MAAVIAARVVYGCPRGASCFLVWAIGCHAVRCCCVAAHAASSCTSRVEYSELHVVVHSAIVDVVDRDCVVASAAFVGATATGVVADCTAVFVSVSCMCGSRRGIVVAADVAATAAAADAALASACAAATADAVATFSLADVACLRPAARCWLPAVLLQLQRLPLPKL